MAKDCGAKNKMNEVVMLVGSMASGKTSVAQEFINKGYIHINRDKIGTSLEKLIPLMTEELSKNNNVVLDNTFGTIKSRKPFIEICQSYNVDIRCMYLNTSVEDAQFNAAQRMIKQHGKLLSLEEIKKSNDPNTFPVSVLFSYFKKFEMPETSEGFSTVETIKFVRRADSAYCNKALILDYDSTLRVTKSGAKYPVHPEDIEILPNRSVKLKEYKEQGFLLLGASNQSGIEKRILSEDMVHSCFQKTNSLLGIDIEYKFCPHGSFPISCYCRKPLPGMFVEHMMKHKLDPKKCTFVGDMTSDKTFAKRAGINYIDQAEFFQ